MYGIGLLERYETLEPGKKARAHARFPEGHPVFEGHFPGEPVLPGVLQIALMLETAERLLGLGLEVAEIRQAKFRVLVKPLDEVDIRVEILSRDENGGAIEIKAELVNSGNPETDDTRSTLRTTVIPRTETPEP